MSTKLRPAGSRREKLPVGEREGSLSSSTSPKGRDKMHRKFEGYGKKLTRGIRGEFTAHLRKLAAGRTPEEMSVVLGCTVDAARKYLRGDRIPPIESWPEYAKALGLSDWRELIPPKR